MLPRTVQLRDSEAEKELPDTASGPQLRSSEVRDRATPRPRGTPNSDGSRTSRKKTANVTITATGQLCCIQRLVGDLGVPVATSRFLVHSRRDSLRGAISVSDLISDPGNPAFGSRFTLRLVRHNVFTRASAIDPFGAQSFSPVGRGATYT
jgi:hypothetical protein